MENLKGLLKDLSYEKHGQVVNIWELPYRAFLYPFPHSELIQNLGDNNSFSTVMLCGGQECFILCMPYPCAVREHANGGANLRRYLVATFQQDIIDIGLLQVC